MKKMNILIFCIAVFSTFILYNCSSKIDEKKILGNWRTFDNNANNTEIKFCILDSNILTEFYFENGIKRMMFKYKILKAKRDHLIIQTINPSSVINIDTLRLENDILSFSTDEGKLLYLKRF
jgi:hypothetical protein